MNFMKLPDLQPSPFQRLIQRLSITPLIANQLPRFLPGLDRAVLALTNGRQTFSTLLTGVPTFRVTTIGARSGLPRTLPLVGIVDGTSLILVASNFGRASHPAWYFNLRAHPQAEISWGGVSALFSAREASAEAYERCWELAVQAYPGYARYRRRAYPRQIPILILEEIAT